MNTIYTGSHSTVRLKDVVYNTTGNPVSDATVEFTLYDSAGVEVVGQVWPLALVSVTPGVFGGTLENTLELKHNWEYDGFCKTTTPEGVVMEINCPMIAKDRACCE